MPEKLSVKDVVKMGAAIRPTVHVGKEGLTEGVAEEIAAQIKRSRLVKVRLLPAAGIDQRDAGLKLAEMTSTELIEVRGFTVLLCDPKVLAR